MTNEAVIKSCICLAQIDHGMETHQSQLCKSIDSFSRQQFAFKPAILCSVAGLECNLWTSINRQLKQMPRAVEQKKCHGPIYFNQGLQMIALKCPRSNSTRQNAFQCDWKEPSDWNKAVFGYNDLSDYNGWTPAMLQTNFCWYFFPFNLYEA